MNHTQGMACQCNANDTTCHCAHDHNSKPLKKSWKQYRLLLIVLALVLLFASTMMITAGYFQFHYFMQYFMAGYFLLFGALQTLSLKKSAKMFQQYDPIAQRFPVYGYIYPLLQIGLGLAYLFWLSPIITNFIAATVLFFTMIGVIRIMEQKKQVRCGCLGESMNVSVGWVTLIENVGMFIMALGMLIYFFATFTPNQPLESNSNGQHHHRSL